VFFFGTHLACNASFFVQVRLDVDDVCRGWAKLGSVADDMIGIVKLRACLSKDTQTL
jgi:hypothetical protein